MVKKIIISLFILIFIVSNTFGAEKVAYTFDSFEIVYAEKYTATLDNWVVNSWASNIVSKGKDIEVLYGMVKFLDKNGVAVNYASFIKVSGDLGKKRYVSTDGSYSANYNTATFKEHVKFSEKGNSIIKLPLDVENTIDLNMKFDVKNLLYGKLSFNHNDDIYPEKNLIGSSYLVNTKMFKSTGKRYSPEYNS